jgi:hypothetical protein
VIETTVQKSIAEKLPGLEVATVKGPKRQLCRNIVQKKNDHTYDDDTD